MAQPAVKLESLLPTVPVAETRTLTLLDLVTAVAEFAENDAEVVATIQHLVASGQVHLVGLFGDSDVDPRKLD